MVKPIVSTAEIIKTLITTDDIYSFSYQVIFEGKEVLIANRNQNKELVEVLQEAFQDQEPRPSIKEIEVVFVYETDDKNNTVGLLYTGWGELLSYFESVDGVKSFSAPSSEKFKFSIEKVA